MQEKIPVVVIVGPTASGKTALGVEVARLLDSEVISADSMQVYSSMPIASAAPTDEETKGVKHHLVGFLSAHEKFSVAEFINAATSVAKDIAERGKVPVLVGGTGLYIDSLLKGITFSDEDCEEVRAALEQEAQEKGTGALFRRLREVDPDTAERLHLNDRKRIIRALEVYMLHGKTMTEVNKESLEQGSRFQPLIIGINYRDREKLYERINKRVDIMLDNGLLEEAKAAFCSGVGNTAVQAIGHKELFPYFEGSMSLAEAIENLKQATRRYAKRQLTWFRRNENINWIYADETDDVLGSAKEILKKL